MLEKKDKFIDPLKVAALVEMRKMNSAIHRMKHKIGDGNCVSGAVASRANKSVG